MSIKKELVTKMFLEKTKEETLDFLAKNIANSFTLLANTDPEVALHVLEQMNSQFNKELAQELIDDRVQKLDNLTKQLHIDIDDLD